MLGLLPAYEKDEEGINRFIKRRFIQKKKKTDFNFIDNKFVLTKNFSSHTLMERLKNLIDLSGNRTHDSC